MGGAAILDLLQHGKPVQRLITVTEGMPAIIVAEKLAANPYLTGADADDRGRLAAARQLRLSSAARARAALVERMQAAMTKALDQLWPKRSTDCPIATPEQAVILASIVEKETGKASRAADDRRRLLQPPADRHEARCRPDRYLPRDQGQAARPPHPQVRAQRRQRLQYLSPGRPARRADRQSRQGEHRGGASPGADQGALFRRRRHRRACLRGDAGRAAGQRRQMVRDPPRSGGRCEEPRDRPRRGCSSAACSCSRRSSPGRSR